jgi:tetratricopeptide (TPR) repeat protein
MKKKKPPKCPHLIAVSSSAWFANNTVLVFSGLILLAVAVAGGILYHRHQHRLPFSERDWVLIAEFENFTGEPVFDSALRMAIERELAHSNFVNVVPVSRVVDTLRLMRQPLNTRINEKTGREICLRDGNIRVLLAGSIQQIGGGYQLGLKVINPQSGVTVTHEVEQGANRQEVLPAIRRLATTVREILGESLVSIAKSDQALEKVTTPSLEALEHHSKGLQQRARLEFQQALLHFNQALEKDPCFAMGYLARGKVLLLFSPSGTADFDKAAGLVEGVTLRENLLIQSNQAFYCQGDLRRAIDLIELLVGKFPGDYLAHEDLGVLYLIAGDLPRWEDNQKEL